MPAIDHTHDEERIGGARVIAEPAVLEFVRTAITSSGSLYAYAAARDEAEPMKGRGTLYVISGPDSNRWVVRHLSHGGLLAPLTGDLFFPFGLERPYNELRVAKRLREVGVPTPEVLAAVVYPSGLMYRGDVARLEIPEARDLADCLFGQPDLDPAARSDILRAAGGTLGSAWRAGLIHPDLNLRNILVQFRDAEPKAFIIDLEKCRLVLQVPQTRLQRMIARLERSARKFEAQTGRRISDSEWDALREGYDEGKHGEG